MTKSKKYTLYLDESGTAGLVDTRSSYLLLTGLIVEQNRDLELSAWFRLLRQRHKIRSGRPFHTVDIFELKGSQHYMDNKDSRALVESLIEFITLAPIRYKTVVLKKAALRRALKLPTRPKPKIFSKTTGGALVRDIAYDILSSHLFFWFSNETLNQRSHKKKGSVVAESRLTADHSLLTSFLDSKNPRLFDDLNHTPTLLSDQAEAMKNRITSIKFETKLAECTGLELADLVSYISSLQVRKMLQQFKKKNVPFLYKKIKTKMADNKPLVLDDSNFFTYLPPGKVHKITNFHKTI